MDYADERPLSDIHYDWAIGKRRQDGAYVLMQLDTVGSSSAIVVRREAEGEHPISLLDVACTNQDEEEAEERERARHAKQLRVQIDENRWMSTRAGEAARTRAALDEAAKALGLELSIDFTK